MSRGAVETLQLQKKLELQLNRLVKQLQELEESKNELEPAEYEESKREYEEQVEEFNDNIAKMMSGDLTLVDKLGSMQLAIQAAVSDAFHTPEVIRAFVEREPDILRQRLTEVERDTRLGKLTPDIGRKQKVEILHALKQLGEALSSSEQEMLDLHGVAGCSAGYFRVVDTPGECEQALATASSQVRSLEKPS